MRPNCDTVQDREALDGLESQPTWWWIGAGVLVAAELATGTFYLLMMALGLAAAALAAHLGVGADVAGRHGGAGRRRRDRGLALQRRAPSRASAPAQSNRDVNLDIGETVRVDAWEPDGTARVTYRGAGWTARCAGRGTPQPAST